MTAGGAEADSGVCLILIAAMARKQVIGRAGGMPWHLPADLQHFKSLTLGHPVIMGRKTYESIGRPLPGRKNIVVSRSAPLLPAEVEVADSLSGALERVAPGEQAMVIGGGQIYAEALPLANRLELTLIDAEIDGDTHFPELDERDWLVTGLQSRPADARNAHALRFVSLTRRMDRN
ncbi:MAG: dihydrofolate reductase [Wenzhouxiangella sp.]|jgi:dihydrofolate reductase|nr:dihydrofolate reductase [Wenzhouxiangella sp.]